jgi:AcrR family transcriptional regulator
MPRVSKNPKERRNELMDAAQMLFLSKGYEKTAVSDIVRQVNVAQGTFYYHFKSKAEILDAVVDRFISVIESDLKTILENIDIDVVTRINMAINKLVEITGSNQEIIDYLHQESNALLHDRIVTITMNRLVPLLARTVKEGRHAGKFSLCHSFETVEMIMAALFWQFHQPGLHEDQKRRLRIKESLEQILDRVLGVEPGSFSLNMTQ